MRFISMAFGCLIVWAVAAAQEPSTDVVVKVPSELKHFEGSAVDQVRVTVNGVVHTSSPGSDVQVKVPASAGTNVDVQLSLINKGFLGLSPTAVKTWDQSVRLNGSGRVEYSTDVYGAGHFVQDPLVTFKVRNATHLEVLIDGAVQFTLRDMPISRGVHPFVPHDFEWRGNAGSVCKKDVTLDGNVTRIYTCDAKTKMVEDE